jgi:hypothetical protein
VSHWEILPGETPIDVSGLKRKGISTSAELNRAVLKEVFRSVSRYCHAKNSKSSPWPVERPANWTARVNAPMTTKELDRVRVSIERGRPYGEEKWVRQTVKDLGLEQTVRPEGRPPKASQATGPTS